MGFLTYSSNLQTMIDTLVDQLVAADGTVFEKITTSDANKACVRFIPENKYIQFQFKKATFASVSQRTFMVTDIGGSYNTGTHEVETGVQRYGTLIYASDIGSLDLAVLTRTYSHTLWVDKYGFFWNFWNPYTDYSSQGFLLAMEFVPVAFKEYDDGSSRIILWQTAAQTNAGTYADTTYYRVGQYSVFQSNDFMFEYTNMTRAYKSLGNNKIYFDFAKYHKNPPTYSNPFVTSKRTFVANKVGLAVNDVLSWINPDTSSVHRFIITEVGSGGSSGTNAYYFAIPYENAFLYE